MKRKKEKGEGERDGGEREKDEICMIAKLQQEVELLLRMVEHRMQRLQGELTLGFHYLHKKTTRSRGSPAKAPYLLLDEDPVESET